MGTKYIALLFVLILCFGCRKAPASPLPEKPQIISEPKFDKSFAWQAYESPTIKFYVPGDWVKVLPEDQFSTVKVIFYDPEKTLMTIYAEEPFDGGLKSYAVSFFEEVKADGGKFEEGTYTKINNETAIEVVFSKQHVAMILFITIKNGFGYAFSCVGLKSNFEKIVKTCESIVLTVSFK